MKIEEIRTLTGPNIYNYKPVIVMKLWLEDLTEKESYEVPGFVERLLERLPAVNNHHCAMGRPGGFVHRLYGGTYFGHIVEHVALEFTEMAGAPAFFGKTVSAGPKGCYQVIVEFRAEEATKFLLRAAVEFVQSLIDNSEYPLDQKIEYAKKIISETELGPSARSIVEAAERRGIPWRRLSKDSSLIQLGYGKHLKRVQSTITHHTSTIAVDIACNKELTNQLLSEAAIPVPWGGVAASEEEAVDWLHKLRPPVVVKPVDGNHGRGVSLNLISPADVRRAYQIAREYGHEVMVEEYVDGKHYRILVVDGRVAAASERKPAHVVGDGRHSIEQLLAIENENPDRGEGHEKPLTQIRIDAVSLTYLARQGRQLSDVPAPNEIVWLRDSPNMSTGGTAEDVTDLIHPEIAELCERAARVIGLDVAGIDIVLSDIANPVDKITSIIEINAAPGIRMHQFPTSGQSRDVGDRIVQTLYPEGAPCRIPIFSITGTNGKTSTTRMIAHIMRTTNRTVGMTSTDGIYVNGDRIAGGDMTGPRSARVLLSDPSIEIAVLETARGGILRAGLGYDFADVAVITNVQPDHIGQDGIVQMEDLVHIKSLVAEAVKDGGSVILNADCPHIVAIAAHPRMQNTRKQIVLFSLQGQNQIITQHLAAGGMAFFVKDNAIYEAAGQLIRRMIHVAEVPVTLSGAAEFQVANALAAIAACRSYGINREQIISALSNFSSGEHNQGRCNLFQVGHGHVMVDYGHNPDAFQAVCKMARNLPCSRVTGVVGVPGDRDNTIVESAAKVAASGLQRIILREDADLRGRQPGEIAGLMLNSILTHLPNYDVQVVLDEVQALETAIDQMVPGEVVVVFYEKLAPILELLNRRQAVPVATNPLFQQKRDSIPSFAEV